MNIEYSLKRSRKRKKTLSLQIGSNADITVYAPYFTPVAEIERFVEEKRNWIDRALRSHELQSSLYQEKPTKPEKNFITWAGPIPSKPASILSKTRAYFSGPTGLFSIAPTTGR